jgi:hypothetical protein
MEIIVVRYNLFFFSLSPACTAARAWQGAVMQVLERRGNEGQ